MSTPQIAVNDIGSAEDFLAAIEGTIRNFNDGDLVSGAVVQVGRDEVLVDIGYKTEGVIPSRELSIRHDADPNSIVKVGEIIEALVLQKEDKEGRLILSKKRAQYERAWGDIEGKKERDEVVVGTVIEVVKGGLIVDIGLRGFLPASLVEMRRVRDLTPYIGKQVEARIIELDKNRNNVVLSRRAFLEQTQSESRTTFLNQLQKGQVRTGVVSSIVNFGAFVDLGGVDGLVHVSELSWKHIDHPGEVVEVGDEVTVEVLEVDFERERVSLSLKATQEDPWQAFARTHTINQVVPGVVTKLVPFGAFVRVADGIEGLVHISELSGKHVELAEQVVSVGDDVFVKVIDIDRKRNRLILSEKVAHYEERREKRDELFSTLSVGQKVSGSVRSIAPFGLFIDLGGIDGLIHKSEISWSKVANPEADYKVGDPIDAEVIDINTERGRISLSIRKLQPDPWHAAIADIKIGDFVEGTITKLVNFGAFVRVRDGLEGLIHISELSHNRVLHPGDVVKDEQTLKLKVISLDSERHRLGLSLKQAEETPVRETPAEQPKKETRRARPERGFSMDGAIQEPEGGLDLTLAAAFAGIRDKMAESGSNAGEAPVAEAPAADAPAETPAAAPAEAVPTEEKASDEA